MSTERLDAPGQRVLAASADPDVAVEVCEAGGPFAISWFGQFVDPAVEHRFHTALVGLLLDRGWVVPVGVSALYLALIPTDYSLTGGDARFGWLVAVRLLVAVTMIGSWIRAKRRRDSLTGREFLTPVIAAGSAMVAVSALRPGEPLLDHIAIVNMQLVLFVFVPARLWVRALGVAILQIGYVAIVVAGLQLVDHDPLSVIAHLFASCLFSAMLAEILSRSRRMEWPSLQASHDLIRALRSEITARERLEQQLQVLADSDALTNLRNRRAFVSEAERQILDARNSKRPVAVACIDVDRFKMVNDTFGHATGDVVLMNLATHLARVEAVGSLAGRWGGEEFGLVFFDLPFDGAVRECEKFRALIESSSIEAVDRSVRVTVSIGVAELAPSDSFYDVMVRADNALYEAKRGGRNQVRRVVAADSDQTATFVVI